MAILEMDIGMSLLLLHRVIETIRHAEPEWMLTASAASEDGSTFGQQQHMSSPTDAWGCCWNYVEAAKELESLSGQIDKRL